MSSDKPSTTPSAPETVPWPELDRVYEGGDGLYEYQRARADAAMSKLRLAVEALQLIAKNADKKGDGCCEPRYVGHGCYSPQEASEALSRIGELPPP